MKIIISYSNINRADFFITVTLILLTNSKAMLYTKELIPTYNKFPQV